MSSLISPIFCQTCGDMLDFQIIRNNKVTCQKCGDEIPVETISEHKEETHSQYTSYKDWKNKLDNTEDKFKKSQEVVKSTIRQDCEKCNNKYFYYFTMQTRSADEGSTVFYECTKCGHKYTLNN